jgi:hypothetical protein
MKTPQNDFLEIEIVAGQQEPVQQQKPVQQENNQQQQQQSYWDFETEFGPEICHGGEIQHPKNPDFREFLPGKKSASAT